MANAIYYFSTSFIRAIEETMDWYDHLAFVLLLSQINTANEWMQRLISLREQEGSGSPNWRKVAVNLTIQSAGMNPNAVTEALFQLKQWKLLGLIGYPFPTPINFIPTGHLCPFRLGLFHILDQLDYSEARILSCCMEKEERQRRKLSPIANIEDNYGFQAIEVAALQWILNGTITKSDCSKLTFSLSLLGRNDLAILSLQLQTGMRVAIHSVCIDVPMDSNAIATSSSTSDDNGLHSHTSSGYCLIVHQKTFYNERDPMLKHRVEYNVPKFSGNEADCRMLSQTFVALGYRVEVVENLTNFELKQKVLDVSRLVDWTLHNGLALCFLSHCIEGRILGCNSLYISFNQDVRKFFNERYCPGLKGKQKAFIFITPIGTNGKEMSSPFDSVAFNRQLYDNFLIVWPTSYVLSQSFTGGSAFITEICTEMLSGTQDVVTKGIKSLQTAINAINNRIKFNKYGDQRPMWSIGTWSTNQ